MDVGINVDINSPASPTPDINQAVKALEGLKPLASESDWAVSDYCDGWEAAINACILTLTGKRV